MEGGHEVQKKHMRARENFLKKNVERQVNLKNIHAPV